VNRRRIQPKVAVELETVSLRLPAQLVRAVEQYAKDLGGSTDRTYVIRVAAVQTHLPNTVAAGGAQPAPPASCRNTAVLTPTLSADLAGPSPITLR